MARRAGNNNTVGRAETGLSLQTNSQGTTPGNTLHHTSSGNKRAASPDGRKRDDGRSNDHGATHKRVRANSPPRAQERDREKWDGPPGRRRFNSPAPNTSGWDHRDDRGGGPGAGAGNGPRGREPLPPPRSQQSLHHDRDDDKSKSAQLPNVLSYFIGQLPTPASFDGAYCTLCDFKSIHADLLRIGTGPVFRTEDLLNLFRTAVIPSTPGRPKSPPMPPPRSGKYLVFFHGRHRSHLS
jgi:cleavage stimulation factor subunit 3